MPFPERTNRVILKRWISWFPARKRPRDSDYLVSRIGLIEEIDRLLDCSVEVSPGRVVLAMILDSLTGRNTLCRLE